MSPETALLERDLDTKISELAETFLNALSSGSPVEVEELAEGFKDSTIPLFATGLDEYMNYLSCNVVAHSVHTASPRFIGHMTSSLPYFVRPLANLLTAMNQNMVKIETAKSFTPYERQALAMIHRLIFNRSDEFYEQHIQNPNSTLGMLLSGGTAANITALWAARNASLAPQDSYLGIERQGLSAALDAYGYRGAVIIGSTLLHYSFEKAAGILGIGTEGLVKVPVDGRNRIDLLKLRRVVADCRAKNLKPIAIIGIAGTTDCGSVDPLIELHELAKEADAHFHVDAAWGGPILFSERHKSKLAGIELADSVTFDGHKQMYLPMGIGMVLLRDPHLAKVIEKHAHYIVRAGSSDLGKRSLEGSRPASILLLHAALNLLGRKGYEFLLDEGIRKTHYMSDRIRSRSEFELLAEPDLNIVVYRYLPERYRERVCNNLTRSDNEAINEFNIRLQERQRQTGYSFVSRTKLDQSKNGECQPVVALRAVLANPLTTEPDIESVLNDQVELAANLSS
jgi:glutamate decarboxylase